MESEAPDPDHFQDPLDVMLAQPDLLTLQGLAVEGMSQVDYPGLQPSMSLDKDDIPLQPIETLFNLPQDQLGIPQPKPPEHTPQHSTSAGGSNDGAQNLSLDQQVQSQPTSSFLQELDLAGQRGPSLEDLQLPNLGVQVDDPAFLQLLNSQDQLPPDPASGNAVSHDQLPVPPQPDRSHQRQQATEQRQQIRQQQQSPRKQQRHQQQQSPRQQQRPPFPLPLPSPQANPGQPQFPDMSDYRREVDEQAAGLIRLTETHIACIHSNYVIMGALLARESSALRQAHQDIYWQTERIKELEEQVSNFRHVAARRHAEQIRVGNDEARRRRGRPLGRFQPW